LIGAVAKKKKKKSGGNLREFNFTYRRMVPRIQGLDLGRAPASASFSASGEEQFNIYKALAESWSSEELADAVLEGFASLEPDTILFGAVAACELKARGEVVPFPFDTTDFIDELTMSGFPNPTFVYEWWENVKNSVPCFYVASARDKLFTASFDKKDNSFSGAKNPYKPDVKWYLVGVNDQTVQDDWKFLELVWELCGCTMLFPEDGLFELTSDI
jgi:hypothetical protein